MGIWKRVRLVLLSFAIFVGLGLGAAFYLLSGSSSGVEFSLNQLTLKSESEKSKSQLIYENSWSEQIEIEKKVRPYENYVINWVSTFIGKSGYKGQNTSSLKYSSLEDKGSYTSVGDLTKVYPNLAGVIESVTINYSYDAVSHYLVQEVVIQKRGFDTTRQVFILYDSTGSVVDYVVGNFNKVGGSNEKD